MLGGEIPDLSCSPCRACGQLLAGEAAVWDPWHTEDRRLAAVPYHRRCAAAVLPPPAPPGDASRCGICEAELAPEVLAAAYAALLGRFEAPTGSLVTPELAWRLASRSPRRWVPEHFACLLGKLARRPPQGGLPGRVATPEGGDG